MDKILTIYDWWDGAILGLTTYGDEVCIYERVFSDEMDKYINKYYLTPISKIDMEVIMYDWKQWLTYMSKDNSQEHAVKWHSNINLVDIAKKSNKYHQYIVKGIFQGKVLNFYSKIEDYKVCWQALT